MIKTLIIQLSSGEFYVCKTDNTDDILSKLRKKSSTGYLYQKKNLGNAKIVFVVKGDYVKKIKSFGSKHLLEMFKAYDPLDDGLHQILS